MDETIYVIFKVQFDFALEVWFSIFHSSAILALHMESHMMNI